MDSNLISYTQVFVIVLMTLIILIPTFVIFIRRLNYQAIQLFFLVLIAFFVRVSAALVHIFIFPLPNTGTDTTNFERLALELSNQSWNELIWQPQMGAWMYSWLGALLYKATIRSPIILQMWNVLLGCTIVILTYLLSNLVFRKHQIALKSALIVTFFPTMILYSAINLREALVICLFMQSIYLFLLGLKNRSYAHVVISFVVSVISIILHSGFVVLIFVYTLIILTNREARGGGAVSYTFLVIRNFFMLSILVGASVVVINMDGLNKLTRYGSVNSLTTLGVLQEDGANAGSAYLKGVTINDPTDLLWQPTLRVAFFYLAPFPWMLRSTSDVVGLIDGLSYMILILLFAVSYRSFKGDSDYRSVLVTLVCLSFTFAMGTSNWGTGMRHRAKVLPMLAIAASAPIIVTKNLRILIAKE